MNKSMRRTFGNGFGSDFGTSPHGLSADLQLPEQETQEKLSIPPSAKPLLTSLESSANQQAPQERAAGVPLVYRTAKVREAIRCIRDAVAKRPHDIHYLRLTDREFLDVYHAVEGDRSRTYKAIRKGFAHPQDLKASDSTWHALQVVMTRRLKKAWCL